jgi:hypothetical protein
LEQKKNRSCGDRWDKTKNRDIIVFGSDVQDKVTIFVSYLVIMNKTLKKITLNMYCCQTYIYIF